MTEGTSAQSRAVSASAVTGTGADPQSLAHTGAVRVCSQLLRRSLHHRGLIALLTIGSLLRLAAMVAYSPALFFNDSWGYLFTAFTGHPVSLSYLRPNGYPVLMRLLLFPGRDLVRLVALQHLAGIVTAVLVYAVVDRGTRSRRLALAAAALILLDGYRIALEQYVMPEAFFTLTLVTAALLLTWAPLTGRPTQPGPTWRMPVLAGLVLAAAVIQREAALFAVPAFIMYLVWSRAGTRRTLAFLIALALPVLGYAALYRARVGVFGLTETSGWTLYGRVAAFASCPGDGIPLNERPVCESAAQRASHPNSPTFYIWDSQSPADRMFHNGHQTRQVQERADKLLGNFAQRVILHQPFDYVDATLADTFRYFEPGATPFNDAVSATSLPATAAAEPVNEQDRRRVVPAVHPRVGWPGNLLRSYRSIVHLPRPILALFVLASIASLLTRGQRRRETVLFTGSALTMILCTAATAGFGMRYLLPLVPLLTIGGALAVADLRNKSQLFGGPDPVPTATIELTEVDATVRVIQPKNQTTTPNKQRT
jgi:hypothetical protein